MFRQQLAGNNYRLPPSNHDEDNYVRRKIAFAIKLRDSLTQRLRWLSREGDC